MLKDEGKDKEKGVAEVNDDLKKPYKEVLESPFTRQIIEFSAPSHQMPTNLRIYDGSTYPDDHISRFEPLTNGNGKCRYGVECFSKRWTARREGGSTGCLTAVLTVGRIFVKEMMKRVDDFVKSEEAFKITELPRGEQSEKGHEAPYKGFRPTRTVQAGGPPKGDVCNNYNRRDHYQPYVPPRQLIRRPKEILATELHLQLPPPPPLVETPKRENMERPFELVEQFLHSASPPLVPFVGRCHPLTP
nr:hypothetical protein [Tanacetum cinerariifolium]